MMLVLAFLPCFAWGFDLQSIDDDLRIFNGYDAKPGQFPYQVSIRNFTGYHNCGGSILNSKWILTAAHCVEELKLDWLVYAGSVFLSSGGTYHGIANFIIHEEYDPSTVTNDIALLELQDEITFSEYARPIEPNTEYIGAGAAVVSGWGYELNWDKPDNLQYQNVMIMTNEDCQAILIRHVLLTNQMCTREPVNHGICGGDSGGPLVVNGKQVGIVSWVNIECGNGLARGYTRLSSFVEWINKYINC